MGIVHMILFEILSDTSLTLVSLDELTRFFFIHNDLHELRKYHVCPFVEPDMSRTESSRH